MAQFGASPREEVGFGLPTILVVKKAHKIEGGKARSSKGEGIGRA